MYLQCCLHSDDSPCSALSSSIYTQMGHENSPLVTRLEATIYPALGTGVGELIKGCKPMKETKHSSIQFNGLV